ncbi:MAG: hypothetical protein IJ048_02865 [Clostridia bacterium]|nr:hypothetical protein [Clostridia bacterium]
MKACVIQPPYSVNYALSEQCFQRQLALMDQCDDSMDLIVLPESCDIPSFARNQEQRLASVEKYNQAILEKAAATARRCHAVVFANARFRGEKGLVNATHAFDRGGAPAGVYFKQHTTPGEIAFRELDSSYTFEPSEPEIIEIDGVRYGFMTCYDFYFYEAFAALARRRPDVIIGCSHQRTDTHDALELNSRFLAYNTNAYVVRASVSMGEDSPVGGCSMIVSPEGQVLANLKSRVGLASAEFDPAQKYYKSAGFGGRTAAHWEYIEDGRRPWKYRPAGSAMVPPDAWMGYPRVCAHRGFNTIAPENSMPAFGAAVAMGAEEIEFDLWPTKDGEIVSIHDASLERVSDGTGKVYEHTYEELTKYDFGIKRGEAFRGMRILRFEDILKKFAGQVIMNIHLKTIDNKREYDRAAMEKIIALIDRYDCRKHVYFMSGNDHVHALARKLAPDIVRCTGGGDAPWALVERAIEYGCQKIQLVKGKFDQAMIDRAHANGIRCNVFWSDDEAETQAFLRMGIDVILTNDYSRIAQVVKGFRQ